MRVYKKTKVSIWDIIRFFYSRISTRYLNLSVSTKGVSLKLQSYEDLIKEKQEIFNDAALTMPREQAITYIFENAQHCGFIVFQSRHTPYFFQFGIRRNGFFLDYVVTNNPVNQKHLERTVTFLKAKGFHEADVDVWEYKGYFFARNGKLKFMDACYKRDTALIVDSIIYLTVEVYKEDFCDSTVICG